MKRLLDTAEDAVSSKASAADAGYLDDRHFTAFVETTRKRLPVINRGTYIRVKAVRDGCETICKELSEEAEGKGTVQIVSLGGGYDTLFLWLVERWQRQFGNYFGLRFFDVDQELLIEKKKWYGQRAKLCGFTTDENGTDPTSDGHYSLKFVSCDLRNVDDVEKGLAAVGFQNDLPTILVAECVLIYLEPDESDTLVEWFTTKCQRELFAVIYEQVNLGDRFGKQMKANLSERGIQLLGAEKYGTIEAHEERFCGFGMSFRGQLMIDVYNALPLEERKRVEALEWLDELEEWEIMQKHWCLGVARRISKI